MGLSSDLISQFVKTTNDKQQTKKETTAYGYITDQNGNKNSTSGTKYVLLDGSTKPIPLTTTGSNINSVTTDVNFGDKVIVLIKNHKAVVTGNLSEQAPIYIAAEGGEAKKIIDKLDDFNAALNDTVKTKELDAQIGRIDQLYTDTAEINKVVADKVDAEVYEGDIANINKVIADKVDAEFVEAEVVKIYGSVDAYQGKIYDLKSAYADVEDLNTKKLSVDDAKITYANIDFSNIGKAAMEYFYANSGLIDNVTVNDGTITGHLVGVTIKGDLIEANTLVADKLVIQGEDGLYYKLNTDGETIESEQTEYNSLNGQIITAKSITATQISVSDLVAFDATIGGFNITEDSIYSEVKDSEGNTTRGIYMDTDGQVNFGDATNYIKYYRDENGNYKLAISADTILYSINGDQHSLADLGVIGEYVKIGTYEDEPCIELGEKDSDFKLLITNTRMLFMEGSNVVAYVTNQSLYIQKAVIKEELQQGGFVWKARSNGNLGLIWKGDS